MMQKRRLGNTDIEIAAIAYGCMGQTHSYGRRCLLGRRTARLRTFEERRYHQYLSHVPVTKRSSDVQSEDLLMLRQGHQSCADRCFRIRMNRNTPAAIYPMIYFCSEAGS